MCGKRFTRGYPITEEGGSARYFAESKSTPWVLLHNDVFNVERGTVKGLRVMTAGHEEALRRMDEVIARLRAERSALLDEAYRYGAPVKANEAKTWVKAKPAESPEHSEAKE
jgi:hypothetical protein